MVSHVLELKTVKAWSTLMWGPAMRTPILGPWIEPNLILGMHLLVCLEIPSDLVMVSMTTVPRRQDNCEALRFREREREGDW